MASSSALQLADLALVWDVARGAADLALIDSDLASDRGLATAVMLSLFTDRRAMADDRPPSGDDRDRRGWWADQFADVDGDLIGSRLWLLDRGKREHETTLLAKQYVGEALEWLIADRVVSAIEVSITTTARGLSIDINVQRPGRDAVTFRYAHAWASVEEDI